MILAVRTLTPEVTKRRRFNQSQKIKEPHFSSTENKAYLFMNIVQGFPSFLLPLQIPKSAEIPNFRTCPAENTLKEIPLPWRLLKKLRFLELDMS